MRDQRQGLERPAAHLAAERDRRIVRARPSRRCAQARAARRRRAIVALETRLLSRSAANMILHEIVGADREKIGAPRRSRRAATAATAPRPWRRASARVGSGIAVPPQISRARASTIALAGSNSATSAIIGNMMRRSRPAAGAQQGAQLHAQQRRAVEPDADRAPAERRILLLDLRHIGQDLVGADVERAEGDRLARQRRRRRLVERRIARCMRGKLRGEHELQFGAEQADRVRAGLLRDAAGRPAGRRSCAARSRRRPW